MMQLPKPLTKGSRVTILAPAKQIDTKPVAFAKEILENHGFVVSISEHCLGANQYFSGTLEERLTDLQLALNNPDLDAILCARGGYGCVQLVDRLDWSAFSQDPKWVVGFSDITVLHSRLQTMNIASIHGTMPLNFQENSDQALQTLMHAVSGTKYTIAAKGFMQNIEGEAKGTLLGGNLAIVTSLLGTNDQPDYQDSILFLEEVGEPLYSIDRMFYSLKKAGVLHKIKGLIVGGMTSLKDSEIPFGASLEEIIMSHTKDLEIPVAFHFPAGHIDDNRALVLGREINLYVSKTQTELTFL